MADKEEKQAKGYKPVWIIVAFLVLIIINFLPAPDELSVVGLRALSVLAFAVIMWVTEAVKYPVSAVMIVGLLIILLGLSPVPGNEIGEALDVPGGTEQFGTSNALSLAFSGFSISALALVAAALFLA